MIHILFRTIPKLHMLEYFQACTLHPSASFVSVALILFWFSIVLLLFRDIESCGLLFLIAHIDSNWHGFAISISISISVVLLLLVRDHYKSLQVRLRCRFSVLQGSHISMLCHSIFCYSTHISIADIVYTSVPNMLWWVGGIRYLLLSCHWFLILLATTGTCGW